MLSFFKSLQKVLFESKIEEDEIEMSKLFVLILFPFLSLCQATIDTGEHYYRAYFFEETPYEDHYVISNNYCEDSIEVIIDYGFFSVADRMQVLDTFDNVLSDTYWQGHINQYLEYPDLEPFWLGYIERLNNNIVYSSNTPPLDFKLHSIHNTNIWGTGRIRVITDKKWLKIRWLPNPYKSTDTDIYIHMSSFFEESLDTIENYDFYCGDSLIIDTIQLKCGLEIRYNYPFNTEGSHDTICGLSGQVTQYKGRRIVFNEDHFEYFDLYDEYGCYYQDTAFIDVKNIYIPNVATEYFYISTPDGKIPFQIYDRWGNEIYKGIDWYCGHTIEGVYVVMCEYKGEKFINDVTILR